MAGHCRDFLCSSSWPLNLGVYEENTSYRSRSEGADTEADQRRRGLGRSGSQGARHFGRHDLPLARERA